MNKLKIGLIVSAVALVIALGVIAIVVGFTVGDPFKKEDPIHAIVVFNNGTVTGLVTFDQKDPRSPVFIRGQIQNLVPNSIHGFHVHEHGDVRHGCTSTGAHFNPYGKQHGAPSDSVRHAGDLGNVVADVNGLVNLDLNDTVISLFDGGTSILGRALVLHLGEDDLGRGENEESRKTGNADARIACGIIGIADLALD